MNDRVAESIREKLGLYVEMAANIIRYGQRKTKEFREDVDAGIAAHAIIGGFLGSLMHQNLFRESVAYDPTYTALKALLVDGIVTR
jgi:hypothetical protein